MINLFKKFLLKVANISKRGTIVYCVTITILFFIAAGMFLTGVLYLYPNSNTIAAAVPLTISGGIILFLLLVSVLMMTFASNYAKKIQTQDSNENKKSQK